MRHQHHTIVPRMQLDAIACIIGVLLWTLWYSSWATFCCFLQRSCAVNTHMVLLTTSDSQLEVSWNNNNVTFKDLTYTRGSEQRRSNVTRCVAIHFMCVDGVNFAYKTVLWRG
eukprot:m.1412919 g.1412919  ORF g.1412919 m.1412919 type:complete len:113 (+) comp25028_c0_seq109:4620-4958(+)